LARQARRDAPGVIHHVILRGIERRAIFADDCDREDLAERLERILPEASMACFAWAFMPNHVHLVVRTGDVALGRVMARLGTGYARAFNRRHDRVGYLFQNRYKALAVEDETHLRTVVAYVHLNPARAGIVAWHALARFAWSGHAALVGGRRRAFQDVEGTLALFGDSSKQARERLLDFMRRAQPLAPQTDGGPDPRLEELVRAVARERGVCARAIRGGGRRRELCDARAVVARRACDELGFAQVEVARVLGLSLGAVSRARRREAARDLGARGETAARPNPSPDASK
jgi:REP element-mobilizing transposase RayT